jgi:MFS family permease
MVGGDGRAHRLPRLRDWFVEKRRRVTGIVRLGDTIGTIAMPILAAALIELAGWRWAFALIGIGAFIVLAPTSRLFPRRPEDFGLQPDGASDDPQERKAGSERVEARRAELLAADVVWTRRDALRSRPCGLWYPPTGWRPWVSSP